MLPEKTEENHSLIRTFINLRSRATIECGGKFFICVILHATIYINKSNITNFYLTENKKLLHHKGVWITRLGGKNRYSFCEL
jgi:hypothetical protein